MFGGSFMFSVFPVMFGIVFVLVIGFFIVTAVRGISQWGKNNKSPVLTVEATVVTKRTNVTHHHHNNANAGMHTSTSTSYYVTFQVESGDRMEMHVASNEYGMLVEGDAGKLTLQGTRYLGFERKY